MTREEAVNWLISITAEIGKSEHYSLWHYEQALCEIKEMLESMPSAHPEYTENEKEMLSMMFGILDQTLSAWYLEINHESFSRNNLYYLAEKLGIDYD